jgi:hypothetical protein
MHWLSGTRQPICCGLLYQVGYKKIDLSNGSYDVVLLLIFLPSRIRLSGVFLFRMFYEIMNFTDSR